MYKQPHRVGDLISEIEADLSRQHPPKPLIVGQSVAVGMAVSTLERYAISNGLENIDYGHPQIMAARSDFYQLAVLGADQNAVTNEAIRVVEAGKKSPFTDPSMRYQSGTPFSNPDFERLLANMINEAYLEAERLPIEERRRKTVEDQVAVAGDELLSWTKREAERDPLFDGLGKEYARQSITEAARMLAKYGLDGTTAVNKIQRYVEEETARKASRGEHAHPVSRELIEEMVAEGFEEHRGVGTRTLRDFSISA